MATIIDRLAVELSLDPAKLRQGAKAAGAEITKVRERAVKDGAGIEKSMDGAAEAVDRLARNALKLFAVFTAGRAIKDFTAEITSADAALGRLATSVGSTPEVMSSLGNAVARSGGSSGAAAGSFERLADSINEIKVTGNSSILPFLYRLQGMGGKQINLNKELSETFADMAENAKNIADQKGVPFAMYLLKQAGVDRDTAALLVKGREAYNKALAESRKIGIVLKEDSEAAQKLQTSIEGLRQTSESFGRTILTALTPTISDLLKRMQDWIVANQGWIKTEIVSHVERFATWLKSIDWDAVGKGVRDFGAGALKLAEAFGGVLKICEALFLFWVGSKALAIVTSILKVAGLLSAGPLGWAIRLAMVGTLGSDIGVPNAAKPGVITRSDDENTGAAVAPSGGSGGYDGGRGAARGGIRRWWGRNMPTWLGGDSSTGGAGRDTGVRRRADLKPYSGKSSVGSWWTPDRQQHAIDRLKAGGVSELGARALVARWAGVEAPAGPTSVNPTSKAFGIAQWLGSRKPGIAGNIDFDAQLDYAIKELQGPEAKALRQLNGAKTNAEAAIGASMYERAENYNPKTGADDWTGKTAAAMDKLVGATKQTATGGKADGSPEPTDGKGVNGDLMKVIKRAQEISEVKFHVHEGLRTVERQADMVKRGWSKTMNSKHLTGRAVDLRADGDPAVGDLATDKYRKINEAVQKAAKEQGVPVEWGGDWKGFKDVPHFQLPDGYKSNAAPFGGDAAKQQAQAAQRAGAMAAIAQTRAAQAAMVGGTTNDNRTTSTNETHIGQINVQTAATDASGIARDIGPAMKRHAFAAAANYARA